MLRRAWEPANTFHFLSMEPRTTLQTCISISFHVDFYLLCYFLSFSKNSDALLDPQSGQTARVHCITILCFLLEYTGNPTVTEPRLLCSEETISTLWLLMDTESGERLLVWSSLPSTGWSPVVWVRMLKGHWAQGLDLHVDSFHILHHPGFPCCDNDNMKMHRKEGNVLILLKPANKQFLGFKKTVLNCTFYKIFQNHALWDFGAVCIDTEVNIQVLAFSKKRF